MDVAPPGVPPKAPVPLPGAEEGNPVILVRPRAGGTVASLAGTSISVHPSRPDLIENILRSEEAASSSQLRSSSSSLASGSRAPKRTNPDTSSSSLVPPPKRKRNNNHPPKPSKSSVKSRAALASPQAALDEFAAALGVSQVAVNPQDAPGPGARLPPVLPRRPREKMDDIYPFHTGSANPRAVKAHFDARGNLTTPMFGDQSVPAANKDTPIHAMNEAANVGFIDFNDLGLNAGPASPTKSPRKYRTNAAKRESEAKKWNDLVPRLLPRYGEVLAASGVGAAPRSTVHFECSKTACAQRTPLKVLCVYHSRELIPLYLLHCCA